MTARFAKDQLKAFIERVERLEEEKKALSDDIRDVFAEAKGNGFDVKALREIVRRRKMDVQERQEQDAILETYMHALGMLDYTPEHRAAQARPTGLQTSAALAQAMADDGLISQEAAVEAARIGAAVERLSETTIARVAANPKVKAALKKLGTPVELNDEERAKGYSAALITPDGTRMAIGSGHAISNSAQPVLASLPPEGSEPSALGCAETDTPSPPSGGDRPRPDHRREIPPGGADDYGDIPPDFRRDKDNRAPFMRKPPAHGGGEPRAPP